MALPAGVTDRQTALSVQSVQSTQRRLQCAPQNQNWATIIRATKLGKFGQNWANDIVQLTKFFLAILPTAPLNALGPVRLCVEYAVAEPPSPLPAWKWLIPRCSVFTSTSQKWLLIIIARSCLLFACNLKYLAEQGLDKNSSPFQKLSRQPSISVRMLLNIPGMSWPSLQHSMDRCSQLGL